MKPTDKTKQEAKAKRWAEAMASSLNEATAIASADLERGDALMRRMFETPPKPHDEMTAKAAKKRAKKPGK